MEYRLSEQSASYRSRPGEISGRSLANTPQRQCRPLRAYGVCLRLSRGTNRSGRHGMLLICASDIKVGTQICPIRALNILTATFIYLELCS